MANEIKRAIVIFVLALVCFAELYVAAPLVLYPNSVVILKASTHRQHNLGGVQRRKDVGFVGLAQLTLQGDP